MYTINDLLYLIQNLECDECTVQNICYGCLPWYCIQNEFAYIAFDMISKGLF